MTSFWQKIRSDFPIVKNGIYLDHAAGGPIPIPVVEKISQYYAENRDQSDFVWFDWIRRREEVRQKVAKFIHAEPEEVTFVTSTSEGMNHIADLIASSGKILTNSCEFPSSTLPWLWRKAQLVWQKPEQGKISLGKMKALLSPKVKTLLTSYVQYSTGFRQDLEALGKLKKNRFLVVNATQGFGALPIDVQKWNADFLVSNSYKWMMAGYGGGVMYIRKKWLKKFAPHIIGWRSMKVPEKMNNQLLDLKAEASRYELGCPSFPTIFAVGAAVDYFSQIGVQKIEKRILALTEYLIAGLQKLELEIISPLEPAHRSGIVVFKLPKATRTYKRLMGKRIYVSLRGEGIRVAPHFYNSFEELDVLLKELAKQ